MVPNYFVLRSNRIDRLRCPDIRPSETKSTATPIPTAITTVGAKTQAESPCILLRRRMKLKGNKKQKPINSHRTDRELVTLVLAIAKYHNTGVRIIRNALENTSSEVRRTTVSIKRLQIRVASATTE